MSDAAAARAHGRRVAPGYVDERVRRAVLAALRHPLWFDSPDEDLAADHRTTADVVRALRAELRRDLRLGVIVQLADELAEEIGWPGSTAELVEWSLRACLDPRFRALVESTARDDIGPRETRHAA